MFWSHLHSLDEEERRGEGRGKSNDGYIDNTKKDKEIKEFVGLSHAFFVSSPLL